MSQFSSTSPLGNSIRVASVSPIKRSPASPMEEGCVGSIYSFPVPSSELLPYQLLSPSSEPLATQTYHRARLNSVLMDSSDDDDCKTMSFEDPREPRLRRSRIEEKSNPPSSGANSLIPIFKNISTTEKESLEYYYKNKSFNADENFIYIRQYFQEDEKLKVLLKSINTIQFLLKKGFIYGRVIEVIKSKLYFSLKLEDNDLSKRAEISIFVDKVVKLAQYQPSLLPSPSRTSSINNLLTYFDLNLNRTDIFEGAESINNNIPLNNIPLNEILANTEELIDKYSRQKEYQSSFFRRVINYFISYFEN